MTAEQFAYWLQGFSELNAEPPSAEQWQAIKDHLALVFNKVTPNYAPRVFPPGALPPGAFPPSQIVTPQLAARALC